MGDQATKISVCDKEDIAALSMFRLDTEEPPRSKRAQLPGHVSNIGDGEIDVHLLKNVMDACETICLLWSLFERGDLQYLVFPTSIWAASSTLTGSTAEGLKM